MAISMPKIMPYAWSVDDAVLEVWSPHFNAGAGMGEANHMHLVASPARFSIACLVKGRRP